MTYEGAAFPMDVTIHLDQGENIDYFYIPLKGQPAKPFSDVRKDHWAAKSIHALSASGIALDNSNGTFGPDKQVTRVQVAAFLYRASIR